MGEPIDKPALFTLLVAVYNAEAYLQECLDSLLRQSVSAIQIICIDDASTDASPQILADYAARDARIEVIRMAENKGQACARNEGLRRARGEWILAVDADDLLEPETLAETLRTAQQHPKADCIVFQLVRFSASLPSTRDEGPSADSVFTGEAACLASVNWRLNGSYAARRWLYEQLPFDATTRVYSDDNTSRIHYLLSREVVVTAGIYLYRQHDNSVTHHFNLRRFDFLKANSSLRCLLEHFGANAAILAACEEHCWRNFVGLYLLFYHHRNTFTPQERQIIRQRFKESLRAMHPERLPHRLRWSPSWLFLRPFWLFTTYRDLLYHLKGGMGRNKD